MVQRPDDGADPRDFDERWAEIVADLGEPVLDLSVKGSGSGANLLAFLRDTPIGKRYESTLKDLSIGGSGDLSAALSTSGKSVDAMIAALSGSGTAALKALKVDGINPDGFGAIIAKADAIGRDIEIATRGRMPSVAIRAVVSDREL